MILTVNVAIPNLYAAGWKVIVPVESPSTYCAIGWISPVLLEVTETDTACVSNGPGPIPARLIVCNGAPSLIAGKVIDERATTFVPLMVVIVGGSLTGFTVTLKVRDVETLSAAVFGAVTKAPAV